MPRDGTKLALFIDGANLYAAAKALSFDIDYRRLLMEFQSRGTLLRAFYYTVTIEDQEYSSLGNCNGPAFDHQQIGSAQHARSACEWRADRLTKPFAILEVATLKRMLGIGLAKVSWPRRSVGCGSIALEGDRAIVADWYLYRTAVDAVKGPRQPILPVAKHRS